MCEWKQTISRRQKKTDCTSQLPFYCVEISVMLFLSSLRIIKRMCLGKKNERVSERALISFEPPIETFLAARADHCQPRRLPRAAKVGHDGARFKELFVRIAGLAKVCQIITTRRAFKLPNRLPKTCIQIAYLEFTMTA